MGTFSEIEKKELLFFARSVITAELDRNAQIIRPNQETEVMAQKRGCFVTLHKHGDLRGCIGTIEPIKSLLTCVEENARNAAFRDPRFPPVKAEELPDIHIEISALTVPQILEFTGPQDLKQKLKPNVHGVILSRGWNSATFLPQVWKQLPQVELFLGHLCRKAGLGNKCWQDRDIVVKTYEVEFFSEE